MIEVNYIFDVYDVDYSHNVELSELYDVRGHIEVISSPGGPYYDPTYQLVII